MRRWGIIFLALFSSGCQQSDSWASNLQAMRIDELSNEVDSLEARVITEQSKYSVTLEPNDTGFSPIATDYGSLTMQIVNVKASANGSKVTVRIGNPLNGTLMNVKADMTWGTTKDGGLQRQVGSTAGLEVANLLPAGYFTNVEIPIADLPPSEFGYLEVANVSPQRLILSQTGNSR